MALRDLAWPAVRGFIRAAFPDVAHLSTAELAAELAGPTPPLVLDVRGATEYAVSHLSGAIHLAPHSDPRPLLRTVAAERSIVTYCSVGYRSARMARAIAAAGHPRVRNLEGSIFAWANEGRPLEPAPVVHPYDAFWGKLLAPGRRAPLSPRARHPREP